MAWLVLLLMVALVLASVWVACAGNPFEDDADAVDFDDEDFLDEGPLVHWRRDY